MDGKTRYRKIGILKTYCNIHDNDCSRCIFDYDKAWCQYKPERLTDEAIDKAMAELSSPTKDEKKG